MAAEIKMPQLGLTMTEGTVTKWFKAVGETVAVGELLFEVATDKITNQIESTAAGTLLDILAPEGKVVPVQSVVAWIGAVGEKPAAAASSVVPVNTVAAVLGANVAIGTPARAGADGWVKASPAARKMARDLAVDLTMVTATGPEGRVVEKDVLAFGWTKASPAARKLAKERGIDLGTVEATGPDGRVVERDVARVSPLAAKIAAEQGIKLAYIEKDSRIMKADVLKAAASGTKGLAVPLSEVPVTGMRKVIAERMSLSWQTAPHVHLTVEVDMTATLTLKDQMSQITGQKASVTEIVVKCAAQLLKEFPIVNSSMIENRIINHGNVNVGIAVALENGLIVPVIRNTDQKSLRELREEIVSLGSRAKIGQLTPDEITGGTFTVTNLGMFGTDHFTPVINPPESAILGVCRVVERPVVVDGEVVIRPMSNFILGFDHRLIDGAVGAKFMARFRELIENPTLLIIG